MNEVIMYVMMFILVYGFYYLFLVRKANSLVKIVNSKEVKYLSKVYKIRPEKVGFKKLANIIGVANAFIISTVITVMNFMENLYIGLGVAFLTLVPLMLFIYHLIGKKLSKEVE